MLSNNPRKPKALAFAGGLDLDASATRIQSRFTETGSRYSDNTSVEESKAKAAPPTCNYKEVCKPKARKANKIKTSDTSAASDKKTSSKRAGAKKAQNPPRLPEQAQLVQIVKKPRTHVNHTYRDCSRVPYTPLENQLSGDFESLSFVERLHHMLAQNDFKHILGWRPHGRAFRIYVPRTFEEQVCPKYFGHGRYSSFLRLLSNQNFKIITRGEDTNCFYHEVRKNSMRLCVVC
jgi:hypothetical protein